MIAANSSNRELWWAFGAIVVITIGYLYVVIRLGSLPAASDLFGHSLGILGFILMLMTETLYTLRKRSRSARWGRMSSWLRFHIFTGLVGPYLVLLHSSWKFNGLAGIVTLLMLIVVFSGFIGRYIYTAIPRSADGAALDAAQIRQQIAAVELELHKWLDQQPAQAQTALAGMLSSQQNQPESIFGRGLRERSQQLRLRRARRKLPPVYRRQAADLENLLHRKRTSERQMASLAVARRMLAAWHIIHVPIGLTLFTAALIHIGAAIYFATLLR